eukprot:CAMPEP_0114500216 /NCGR_PEP_ID=MMETSP0109-20121206/7841_1 /TAXON_ID=29199 /ORGANISM="Chlorarachnion reptans, Strain CCCM449" /LENGTH=852 /DNA_ID=CAMNT_0001677853 /DNA_START=92 /DNA_END=2650 /DNA_ORIENTATION=-
MMGVILHHSHPPSMLYVLAFFAISIEAVNNTRFATPLFPPGERAADYCSTSSTTLILCETICNEAITFQLLPSSAMAFCVEQCATEVAPLSEGCKEALCDWSAELVPAIFDPTKQMRLLEASFTSAKTLTAALLSYKSVLSISEAGGQTSGWDSLSLGYLKNFGAYDGCEAIDGAHYCLTKIEIAPGADIGPFALCVPSQCGVGDVNTIWNGTETMIAKTLVNVTRAASPNSTISVSSLLFPLVTTCGDNSYPLDASAAAMISVLVLLAIAMLTATCLTAYYFYYKPSLPSSPRSRLQRGEYMPIEDGRKDGGVRTGGERERVMADKASDAKGGPQRPSGAAAKMPSASASASAPKPETLMGKVLVSLSLTSSWNSFFTLRKTTGTEAMDGCRVFSMMWVIFGHTLLWPITNRGTVGYTNINDLVAFDGNKDALLATWWGQVIPSAEFSVDTFFMMSGFLAAFVSLKKLRGKTPSDVLASAPVLYLHRWLRITPIYMLVIWTYTFIIPLTMKGPNLNMNQDISACKNNWWYNFLYVQTVFPDQPERGSCYGVSWYLADDMMFFWSTPILLAVYQYDVILGVLLPFLLCCGSVAAGWIIAWKKQLRIATFDKSPYFAFYYNPPWTRAPPYLLGIMFGMFYYRWKKDRLKIPKAYQLYAQGSLGVLAGFLMASTVYGMQKANQNVPSDVGEYENNAYIALSKPAWSIGVGIMLFLCFEGYGGPVQWLLSQKFFGYASKLTFLMYLLHPMILALMFFNRVTAVRFSIVNFSFSFVAALFSTAGLAFVCHLAIEAPLASLQGILMGYLLPQRKKSNPEKTNVLDEGPVNSPAPVTVETRYFSQGVESGGKLESKGS